MPARLPAVRVLYQPKHIDAPILPTSAEEFAAVVDAMAADDTDFMDSYATVFIETTRGSHILLGLGVFARKDVGAILYQGDLGEYYTKGDRPIDREVFYLDFGNARYFPPDSEIALTEIKATLAALFDNDGALPSTVAWQQWVDTEH